MDEAHQLEDVATQYFGVAFSNFRVDDLVRDGERLLRPHRSRTRREIEGGLRALAHRVAEPASVLRSAVARAARPDGGRSDARTSRVRYTAEAMAEHAEDGLMLAGALEGSKPRWRCDTPRTPGRADDSRISSVGPLALSSDRAGDRTPRLRSGPAFLLRADDPDFVYYRRDPRAAASSCARRRSTCRASSARRCSIASAPSC